MRTMVLKLDLDRKKLPRRALAYRVKFLNSLFGLNPYQVVIHKTRHGFHVRIYINKGVRYVEAIAMQCMLGSDWRREAFSLERILNGGIWTNVLHVDTERKLVFRGSWTEFLDWAGVRREEL